MVLIHEEPDYPPVTYGVGRIRRIVGMAVLATAAVAAGALMAGLRDDALFTTLGFVFYLSAAWAVALEARRVHSPLPPVHDVRVDLRQGVQLAVVVVSTFVVSLAGLYLTLIVLSWPFEDWVTTTFLIPDEDKGFPDDLVHRALFTIETVALGPMVEELLFRGVMLHWWAQRWGLRRAVLASALIFGAMHFDPIGSTLFALVATALYMSFGTMLVPIVFHSMWNCTVIIMASFSEHSHAPAETLASFRAAWPIALAWLVVAAVALSLTIRGLRPPGGWQLPLLRYELGPLRHRTR